MLLTPAALTDSSKSLHSGTHAAHTPVATSIHTPVDIPMGRSRRLEPSQFDPTWGDQEPLEPSRSPVSVPMGRSRGLEDSAKSVYGSPIGDSAVRGSDPIPSGDIGYGGCGYTSRGDDHIGWSPGVQDCDDHDAREFTLERSSEGYGSGYGIGYGSGSPGRRGYRHNGAPDRYITAPDRRSYGDPAMEDHGAISASDAISTSHTISASDGISASHTISASDALISSIRSR